MKIPYDEKYKSMSIFDFPKVNLKKGEVARVLMIETESNVDFAHYIDLGEQNELNGYYVCLGDFETMCKNGFDEKCPFCKKARTGSAVVRSARRRFATHIIKYRTDAKGNVLTPIAVELNLWVYGDDKYNSLTSKAVEWGDLRKHDLKLTCTKQQYQTFEIEVLPEALWMKDPNLKALVVKTYQENKRNEEDINLLLGRRYDASEAIKIVYRIETGGEAPPDAAVTTIGSGLPADILDLNAGMGDSKVAIPTSTGLPGIETLGLDKAAPGAPGVSVGGPGALDFDVLLNTK